MFELNVRPKDDTGHKGGGDILGHPKLGPTGRKNCSGVDDAEIDDGIGRAKCFACSTINFMDPKDSNFHLHKILLHRRQRSDRMGNE